MKLIVNADDFGYSHGVNYGIVDSFKDGIVKATTMLATMPGFLHACELANAHPELDIGIHLALDLGKPTLPVTEISSIVDENGQFFSFATWCEGVDFSPEDVYKEWKNQIECVLAQGVTISHIDSHHHLHMQKGVLDVYLNLAHEYGLGIRFFPFNYTQAEIQIIVAENKSLKKADRFSSEFFAEGVSTEFFKQLDGNSEETLEIMAHPAYLDQVLLDGSSYLQERVAEAVLLTSQEVKDILAQKEIELISFKEL